MDGADSPKPLLVTVGLFLLFISCLIIMFAYKFLPGIVAKSKEKPAVVQKQIDSKDKPGASDGQN